MVRWLWRAKNFRLARTSLSCSSWPRRWTRWTGLEARTPSSSFQGPTNPDSFQVRMRKFLSWHSRLECKVVNTYFDYSYVIQGFFLKLPLQKVSLFLHVHNISIYSDSSILNLLFQLYIVQSTSATTSIQSGRSSSFHCELCATEIWWDDHPRCSCWNCLCRRVKCFWLRCKTV